jgi:hypothetical protein
LKKTKKKNNISKEKYTPFDPYQIDLALVAGVLQQISRVKRQEMA